MKRMTLLTALALVFSLFTVTTAIAARGEGTRGVVQGGDTLMAKTHNNEGKCQATDDCPAGVMVMTQTRNQNQTQTQASECLAGDDCPAGDQTKTQTREQTATQTKDFQADEAVMLRERVMNRILEMLSAENAEVEAQYRLLVSFMLQNMHGFIPTFV